MAFSLLAVIVVVIALLGGGGLIAGGAVLVMRENKAVGAVLVGIGALVIVCPIAVLAVMALNWNM